jgi:hypothetical protein
VTDVDTKAAERLYEMGPIDYVVIEWPREQPTGTDVPKIVDLVDRGIIRIIDVAFVGKDSGGAMYAMELSDFDGDRLVRRLRGRADRDHRRRRPHGGRHRPRAGDLGRRPDLGEPLGRAGRRRAARVRRPARRERPDPHAGHHRRARRRPKPDDATT